MKKTIGMLGFVVCLLILLVGGILIRVYHWWYVPELTEMQVWWIMAKWEWPAFVGVCVFGWMAGIGEQR